MDEKENPNPQPLTTEQRKILDSFVSSIQCPECDAKAKEIEQLRSRLSHWIKRTAESDARRLGQSDEIERLREALRLIRDHPEEDGVADSMEAIARESLKQGSE